MTDTKGFRAQSPASDKVQDDEQEKTEERKLPLFLRKQRSEKRKRLPRDEKEGTGKSDEDGPKIKSKK